MGQLSKAVNTKVVTVAGRQTAESKRAVAGEQSQAKKVFPRAKPRRLGLPGSVRDAPPPPPPKRKREQGGDDASLKRTGTLVRHFYNLQNVMNVTWKGIFQLVSVKQTF